MDITERIQHLRKAKGLSQEELAERIGVSRQAVSKWESGQSVPDIDKIILLSDYFGTTTDFLLKGTVPESAAPEVRKRYDAAVFAMIGTVVNAVGWIDAVVFWLERQTVYAVGLGLVMMLVGTGIFLVGQIIDTNGKQRARRGFLQVNVWILPFIPLSCCFNLLDGLAGGFSGQLAPLPMLGNSFVTFGLYWILYIGIGIAVDLSVAAKAKRGGEA